MLPGDKHGPTLARPEDDEFELGRPLMMFLRSVPSGYQCHFDEHTFIPLKRYCEAAAVRIERLEEQLRNNHGERSGDPRSPAESRQRGAEAGAPPSSTPTNDMQLWQGPWNDGPAPYYKIPCADYHRLQQKIKDEEKLRESWREQASIWQQRSTPSATVPNEALTEAYEELFGNWIEPTGISFPESTYRCLHCECAADLPRWLETEHEPDCIITKAKAYLLKHKPEVVRRADDTAQKP